jgi:hypothetical protein
MRTDVPNKINNLYVVSSWLFDRGGGICLLSQPTYPVYYMSLIESV